MGSVIPASTQLFNSAFDAFANAARNSTALNLNPESGGIVNQTATHRYGTSSSRSAVDESVGEREEAKLDANGVSVSPF